MEIRNSSWTFHTIISLNKLRRVRKQGNGWQFVVPAPPSLSMSNQCGNLAYGSTHVVSRIMRTRQRERFPLSLWKQANWKSSLKNFLKPRRITLNKINKMLRMKKNNDNERDTRGFKVSRLTWRRGQHQPRIEIERRNQTGETCSEYFI